jgi:putative salt-induced outer membrane protein YdiY
VKSLYLPFLALSICFTVLPYAAAEETEPTNTGSWNAANWATAKPGDIEADWVQTTSGEWLTGEIILIYDYELEFDSDEFDEVKIDMDDVQYLKSYWPQILRFVGLVKATGTIELADDKITVTSYDGTTSVYPRDDLVSMISGEEVESSYWQASVALGANIRKGNSDEVDYNAKINLKRQTIENRFIADYLGDYSTVDNERTVNTHRLTSSYDIFMTRYFFWQPIFGEYFRDRFQNIDSRILLGTGAGYHIIKTSKTEWDISGGPAVQETRFVTVQPGEDNTEVTPSLSINSSIDTEVNSKVDFINTYNISFVEQKSGGYTHHMIATIETEITGSLDFDVSLIWDHINKPTPRDDGTIPERNDTQIVFAVKYEF